MSEDRRNRRRSIRLSEFDYARYGPFFVTLCAEDRKCIFGTVADGRMKLNRYGQIIEDEWMRTAEIRRETSFDAYVVMPNHFHSIVSVLNAETEQLGQMGAHSRAPLRRQSRSLGALIAQFKATTTRLINSLHGTPGATIWQRNYYEHVIRDERDLERIRDYIAANPARWEEDGYHPNRLGETGAHSRAPLRDP